MATIKRFSLGTLTTSSATQLTAAAGDVVKEMLFSNITGTAATVTVTVAGNAFITALSIPANRMVRVPCLLPLNASEVINAQAGTASAIVMMLAGISA